MFGVVLEWFIRIYFLFSFWASTTLQRPLGVLLQESCSFSRGGTGLHFIAQCWLCNVVVLFYRQGVSMCGVAELPLYRVPVCIVFFKVLYQHVSTQFDCSGIKRYAVRCSNASKLKTALYVFIKWQKNLSFQPGPLQNRKLHYMSL